MLTVNANERPNGGAHVKVQRKFVVTFGFGQNSITRNVWSFGGEKEVTDFLVRKFGSQLDPTLIAQIRMTDETRKRMKRPTLRTLEKWSMDSVVRATDGCKVEPDGECSHGAKSWLLELHMI